MTDVTVYHNPACGTSRNVLVYLQEAGIEHEVVLYLKTPPSRDRLLAIVRKSGGSLRDLLREKGTPYAELGLGDPAKTDDELIEAILAHPILMNRPIVETATAARLCRPSESVKEFLGLA